MTAKNHKLFKELFNLYYAGLCSFANGFLSNSDLCEDIVQEVFVNLWHANDKMDEIQSVKSYLYTSVRNRCLNEIQHLKVKDAHFQHELFVSDEAYFTELVIEEETHRMIYTAIDQLPERCREVVQLSLSGLKNQEIAEQLDISVNTVKTQKKIAYEHLRVKLKDLLLLAPFFFDHFR